LTIDYIIFVVLIHIVWSMHFTGRFPDLADRLMSSPLFDIKSVRSSSAFGLRKRRAIYDLLQTAIGHGANLRPSIANPALADQADRLT
jgi:hypothetical protein